MARREPRTHRPSAWRWWHTALLLVILAGGALMVLMPTDAAAFFGQVVVDSENAMYIRAGLMVLPLLVALLIRAHPWPHTLICLMFSLFGAGQLLRAQYTPDVKGIALSLFIADVGILAYTFYLAARPSVYEQLDAALDVIEAQEDELASCKRQERTGDHERL